MLSRFPDWHTRLDIFLRLNRARKFQYGSWDCCLFTSGCVQAMTGVDIAAGFRDRYTSRTEALEAVAELAGTPSIEAIADTVARSNGMLEVPVNYASRGDMVLMPRRRDFSLGIVSMNGTQILIALREGFGAIPFNKAVRAWRV